MDEVIFIDPETMKTVHEKKKPIRLNSKYFTTTTGMSYYDGILNYPKYHKANKGLKGTIKMITPDQYLVLCAQNRTKFTTPFQEQQGIYNPLVTQYVEQSLHGSKMPIPVIDKVHNEQEGRHRAMVAKQLGLKKIPVLFVEETK